MKSSLNTLKSILSSKSVLSNTAVVKGGVNGYSDNNPDYTIGEPWDNRKRPGTKGK